MELFVTDNFTQRRSTGNNLYDPESLLTGEEIEKGLGYEDKRQWKSPSQYLDAVEGKIPVEDIPKVAPRMKMGQEQPDPGLECGWKECS